jgi:hypothetical protein
MSSMSSIFGFVKKLTNLFPQKKKQKPHRFESFVDDLVLDIDFSISDYTNDKGENWAAFTLLRGRYKGIKFKFNGFSVHELPDPEADETAYMELDYDILKNPTSFTQAELSADAHFVNTIFNVAYAIIMTDLEKLEEKNDIGRDDIGEPDRE